MESKELHLIRLYLILFMFFLFLSGCAQQIRPQTPIYDDWKPQLSQQLNWQVEGKLAFISPEDRQSANLNWQQDETVNQLILTSFIGTRILALTQTRNGAELEYDGDVYDDINASRLLARLTGFSIPMDNADDWLKGTVDDPSLQVDELGRAKNVTWQAANGEKWQINYGDYQQYAGFWLPKKLTLKHRAIKIKIQLYEWHFN